jgi:peptidoglycan/LPS O-acetylase OafA/YrhL
VNVSEVRRSEVSLGGSAAIQSSTEIRSLTGLRGIAAVYVLLFHYFPLSVSSNVSNPLKRILDHGYLAVDLFFVLSGFVMALSYHRSFAAGWSPSMYLRFLGRRIARIYPLYLGATIVGFFFVVLGWIRYTQGAQLGWALFANLFMVQAWGIVGSFDSPAWSISAEWAAYLAFPALLIPTMFRKPWVGWLSAIICTGILALFYVLPASLLQEHEVRQPFNFNGYSFALPVVRCIPEFALGILAFRLTGTPFGRRLAASPWIAIAVGLAILALLTVPRSDLGVVLLFPILVTSLASGNHLPDRMLGSPPAELVGRLSYSIYLTHKLLLGLLTWIYLRARATGMAHASLYAAVICMALTLGIALLAYRTIEEPGRRRLRRFFEGGPSDALIRSGLSPTVFKA